MDNFITPVVNSKAAEKDLFDIKAGHADMLLGMQNQQIKVQAYNQQKADQATIEQQAKTQTDTERMKIESDNQKHAMTLQSDADKNKLAMDMKSKELEVKRLALTTD